MLYDLSKPPYDQTTFDGRFRHFLRLTNPVNVLKTASDLDQARDTVAIYKEKGILPANDAVGLWQAKYLYDSAHHPDTGDRQNIFGRMSFQVPGGMIITGILLAFYRSPLEIFLGQWLNQSFNALVNYTNRSGDSQLDNATIGTAYLTATGIATGVAIGFNKYGLKPLPAALKPLLARFVPFTAVAAANAINIPMMRQNEIKEGIPLFDGEGKRVGSDRIAAAKAINKVVISRITIAAPGMLLLPVIMQGLENKGYKFSRLASCCVQTGLLGVFLLVMVPVGCSLFPQQQSIEVNELEPDVRSKIKSQNPDLKTVYYNKGL